ncbi:MAG: hypothetical protein E4H07_04135 [Nitrosomonadales bacterium]|nr:MAG: hypothetical protein E4H07_04135 [Nitrosomonadales bacterium]
MPICFLHAFLLSGCANNNLRSSAAVGPSLSSSYSKPEKIDSVEAPSKLDVIIPVFDPGLPKDQEDYEDENIWPELRRAEANRFAYKLKEKLEATGRFGSIRVTPDKTATGDLYILCRIEESNGEEVEITVKVIDISGQEWLDKSFEHEVSDAFHKNHRNKDKDPYDSLFEKAATEIAEALNDHDPKRLEDLRYLSDLRFGAGFSDSAFMRYIEVDGDRFNLVSKPSDHDPMLQRVKAIRVRDQLFIDDLQNNYAAFSAEMNDSYLMWQKQSLLEIKAKRTADRKAIAQAVGGAALIGLGVLAAVAGASSNSNAAQTAGTLGLLAGGIGGAVLISQGFRTSEEAKVHRDSLNELGQSVDLELAPRVIDFNKKNIELTGNAKEQFMQWRTFLQKIYSEEETPNVQF